MQTVKNILFQYFFDGMHIFYCGQLLETALNWSDQLRSIAVTSFLKSFIMI